MNKKTQTAPQMKPAAYLAQHPLTKRLKALGVTAAQLKGAHFAGQEGDRFRDWLGRSVKPWPANLHQHLKVWCTLRWLILDNPPSSQDKEDAWDLVADYMARPTYEATRRQQRGLAGGRKMANDLRGQRADAAALAGFLAWEQRVRAALYVNGQLLPAAERVDKYFTSLPPSRRRRERIARLLQQGKIS